MIELIPLQAEKFLVEAMSLALQNPVVAAVLVIIYFQYTIRFGVLHDYFSDMDSVKALAIALAEANDNIDDEAVSEEFNGGDSSNYLKDG